MKYIQRVLLLMLMMSSLILAVTITSWKTNYPTGNSAWIKLENKPNNQQDWVGIYPAGTNTDWKNVVQWTWARNPSPATDPGDWYEFLKLPDGNYEARFFLNNTYRVEESIAFSVGKTTSITTSKVNYALNENITVKIKNQAKDNRNWIGIYPKGASNDWANVVVWEWTHGENSVLLDGVSKGDYEARLFYNNSFKLEAKVGVSVNDNVNNYEYGSKGSYFKDVKLLEKQDYFAYYPKNNIQGAPLVLISAFSSVRGYNGLMQYLASQGCYVVAHVKPKKGEGWSDPLPRIKHFEKALSDVKKLGVDTSRLVTMGSSAGGMVSYKTMEHFKKQGYGTTKSFIIDIEGYYAPDMTKNALNKLNSDSLILHLGGYNGVQDNNFSEDPRTLLSISKILNNTIKKSFIVLNSKNHGYAGGTYADVIKRKDLLIPIDAMLKYEFFNENGQYNNAQAILFDNYNETVQKVYDATMNFIGNKGDWHNGYKYPCVNPYNNGNSFEPTIDYCNDHGLQ